MRYDRVAVAVMTALSMSACTSTAEPMDLDALPLAPDLREELAAVLPSFESRDARDACTQQELDYLTVSLILYAVYQDADDPEAWSPEQKSRMSALRERREGYDASGMIVSPGCEDWLLSLEE